MITGSIVLALAAAILLVHGLVHGPDAFYYSSIGASALAGLLLLAGLRQNRLRADPAVAPRVDPPVRPRRLVPVIASPRRSRSGAPARGRASVMPALERTGGEVSTRNSADSPGRGGSRRHPPAQWAGSADSEELAIDGPLGDSPLADEPAEQALPATAVVQLTGLVAEVAVTDGRPRYHLTRCLHLLGRQTSRLPIAEAVELGFTPCALCAPATTLLAAVPQR